MTLTRHAINTSVTKAYGLISQELTVLALSSDDLSRIYNDVYKELCRRKPTTLVRKLWIRSLKKELLIMIEELYQIPNN